MSGTNHDVLAHEPFTLVLGAGFFGFFAHTGLVLALEQAGLRPARIVGVSAGALAGGLWASGIAAADLAHTLEGLRRPDFWDPGLPLGGLLRGERFAVMLTELLEGAGVVSVADAPIPFAAIATNVLSRRPVVLDRGPMVTAIRASCTVPIMFRPLVVEGSVLVDGGMVDRPGLCALRPGERALLHHLPHQSPWSRLRRRRGASRLSGPGRMVVTVPDLPRVSPFRLERGPTALRLARAHIAAWLGAPAIGASPPDETV